jgi:hypothetical protein
VTNWMVPRLLDSSARSGSAMVRTISPVCKRLIAIDGNRDRTTNVGLPHRTPRRRISVSAAGSCFSILWQWHLAEVQLWPTDSQTPQCLAGSPRSALCGDGQMCPRRSTAHQRGCHRGGVLPAVGAPRVDSPLAPRRGPYVHLAFRGRGVLWAGVCSGIWVFMPSRSMSVG